MPGAYLVLGLVALVERAQRRDRRCRQAESLTGIAQQLLWQGPDMIQRVAAGPQKDQLDGGACAAIAPETFIDRGHVAVAQRKVTLGVGLL
ncbi:hypothetical protein WK65_16845 [Burkholderia ubonensis]|nr:hypothetical protein WK65_16845 [Burkholderia ubonensis]